jgi:hypothetical protein
MVTSVGKPCWSYEVTTSSDGDAGADDKAGEEGDDGDWDMEPD